MAEAYDRVSHSPHSGQEAKKEEKLEPLYPLKDMLPKGGNEGGEKERKKSPNHNIH
jgi:hypothetical protein